MTRILKRPRPFARRAGKPRRRLRWAMRNFDRVSLDLIYARPEQSETAVAGGIERSANLRHRSPLAVSAHHRTGTPFAVLYRNGALKIPDETLAVELYEATQELNRSRRPPRL